MIPYLDNLLPSRHIVSAVVTTAQKVVFVLYISVSLWTGSLLDTFNQYLLPRKPDSQWFPIFAGGKEVEGCDTFLKIYTRHRCIRALFLRDESELHDPALDLPESYKWQYLLIMRSLHLMAPLVFQMSFLLVPITMFILLSGLTRRVVQFLGYASLWRRAKIGLLRLSSRARFQRSKLEDVLYLSIGFLAASFVACLYPAKDNSQTCGTPSCLYCYPRLLRTLFKNNAKDDTYYKTIGELSKMTFSSMMFISTAVLECVLFAATITFLCLVVYVAFDALMSLWRTGNSIVEYISNPSKRQDIQTAWNQCINSVKESIGMLGEGDTI